MADNPEAPASEAIHVVNLDLKALVGGDAGKNNQSAVRLPTQESCEMEFAFDNDDDKQSGVADAIYIDQEDDQSNAIEVQSENNALVNEQRAIARQRMNYLQQ